MTDSSTGPKFVDREFRRHWRTVAIAGLLGTIYAACVASAPRTKYLVDLSATPFDFGLIAGLSAIALTFQVASGIWTNLLRRRKPLWIALSILYRLLFVGVLAAPALFVDVRLRMAWIIGVLFVTEALRNLGEPMWYSWMTDLMPRESLNRHWASRQRFITGCGMGALALIALAFLHFENSGQVIRGFTILAAAGIVFGIVDICLFFQIPEPAHEDRGGMSLKSALLDPLRNADFRPFLVFRSYWNFAIMVASPFFYLYLISVLKMRVLTVQTLFVVSSLGVELSSRLWGMLCDTYGQRPVLQMIVLIKPIIPLAYLLIPPAPRIAIPAYVLLFFFDGLTNAGSALAVQGVMLKSTPRLNRSMYIAAANFLALGVAGGIAPLISGSLIRPLTDSVSVDLGLYHFSGFHVIFLISALLRIGAYPLAFRLREPRSEQLWTMMSYLRRANPFVVSREASRMREAADERQRAKAARRLGRLQSPLAIHELICALEDPSDQVRSAAADSLGRIGMAEASGPLARVLRDPAARVQSRAARALGRIGGADSLKALLNNMTRLDQRALGEMIGSLGRIGDSAAILPLICLFHEVEDVELRRRIAAALGMLSQTESVEEVVSLLSPQQTEVERH